MNTVEPPLTANYKFKTSLFSWGSINLIRTARQLLLSVCFINTFWFIYAKISIFWKHPYIFISTTSLQRPIACVPKVAVVKRFDCSLQQHMFSIYSEGRTITPAVFARRSWEKRLVKKTGRGARKVWWQWISS